ncbi:MAG: MaoC family dehydratase N-terminal domain-containing protein [Fimbriiglobus sp.]|jgi:acyl dehydratase|nr:MaoC family dehydratase N-terminal domain-containing protein [Fimbriiglobus sp.]
MTTQSTTFLYLEDLDPEVTYQSAARTVTQADILTFAGFSGDFNPIHIDHEFAKDTPFRQVIVHGFGVFSIASGLGTHAPATKTVALIRVKDWTFTAPVYVGDTIRVLSRVAEKTVKGVGKRGEVVWFRQIVNQHNKVVQEGHMVTMIECRPKV